MISVDDSIRDYEEKKTDVRERRTKSMNDYIGNYQNKIKSHYLYHKLTLALFINTLRLLDIIHSISSDFDPWSELSYTKSEGKMNTSKTGGVIDKDKDVVDFSHFEKSSNPVSTSPWVTSDASFKVIPTPDAPIMSPKPTLLEMNKVMMKSEVEAKDSSSLSPYMDSPVFHSIDIPPAPSVPCNTPLTNSTTQNALLSIDHSSEDILTSSKSLNHGQCTSLNNEAKMSSPMNTYDSIISRQLSSR